MKDAFGAAYYIKVAILFIAIFASMLAVALNYAKAFRIKNTIISYIEANDGLDDSLKQKIDNYVAEMKYYVTNVNPGSETLATYEAGYVFRDGECEERGYCIYHYSTDNSYTNTHEYRGDYYKVVTYIQIQFPFFNVDVKIPVTGETILVTNKYT